MVLFSASVGKASRTSDREMQALEYVLIIIDTCAFVLLKDFMFIPHVWCRPIQKIGLQNAGIGGHFLEIFRHLFWQLKQLKQAFSILIFTFKMERKDRFYFMKDFCIWKLLNFPFDMIIIMYMIILLVYF